MKTIYIDADYICHPTDDGTRTPIDTDVFDSVCPQALECYKFIPKVGNEPKFIQCFDSKRAEQLQKSYDDGIDSQDSTIAELMDEMESICNELIGE